MIGGAGASDRAGVRGGAPVQIGAIAMEVDLQMVGDAVLARMRGEYREMPGLKLTAGQARRLWGLDAPICDALLEELVETGFLRRARDGSFSRADPRP